LYDLRFWIKYLNAWETISSWGSHNIDRCNTCQQYKNRSEALVEKLMPNAIPEKPWSHISVDIITKLPLAQGYNAILVVYDRFSKMAHFVVTTEKMMAEGTCQTI